MIKMIKILAKCVKNTVRIAKMPTLEILLAARLTGNPSQKMTYSSNVDFLLGILSFGIKCTFYWVLWGTFIDILFKFLYVLQ